ncbi:glycosyltransferase family protein [Gryllotalpicola koreensis]|uniref:Spore protein YkvP/CgeB glycosyl transferase-like domain-containing protein n=1 Tax=Gryllotalpicola koreensis TaxID=993086 RepID=A0ABP7ZTU2_9MICO
MPVDAVFTFSYETYADARAREMMRPPDRILETLIAEQDEGGIGRLLVANPFRSVVTVAAHRLLRDQPAFPATDVRQLFEPMRLARSDAADPAEVARQYAAYDRALRRAAARFGLERPAVITTNPVIAGFAPLAWAGSVTYFGRDDWLTTPAKRRWWPVYAEAYARIARSGIAVTAVSRQIIDRIAASGVDAGGLRGASAVVPNGVDPREWLGPAAAPPAWFAALPAPRAVHVGTLDTRIDVEGIAALAAARPELSIVLLGSVPDERDVAPLRPVPNITIAPHVGRAELVAVLRATEITLLAHRRTPLTEAMSPLKLYEYLAAGAPVLAVDLPPVRGLGPRVLLTEDVAGFAGATDAALALGRAPESDRERFVDDNSWRSRHRALLELALPAGANISPR